MTITNLPDPTTWAATRLKNFPTWVQTAYPDTFNTINLNTLSTHHLKDLYPYIWAYGPRGENYITQIDRVHDLLSTKPHMLIDSVKTEHQHMYLPTNADGFTLLDQITKHALETGHPIHCHTYNYGTYDSNYPIKIVEHPTWTNITPQDKALFAGFLDNFSIISLHHDYLTSLPDIPALNYYHTFCERWGIPQ